MRIEAVRIEGMGPHDAETFAFHPVGLQVVYGDNESGKSTFLAAIRGGLFGVSHLTDGHLSIRPGARVQITMRQESGASIVLERTLTKRQPPKMTLENGTQFVGQSELLQWFPELAQVDSLLFDTFFTLQLSDLVAFAKAPSSIANQLFGLQTPIVNPYALETSLERQARDMYLSSRRATKPTLNVALSLQRETLQALRHNRDEASWYRDRVQAQDQLERQLEEEQDQLMQAQSEHAFMQICVTARLDVMKFVDVERQLMSLGPQPSGDYSDWAEARDILTRQADAHVAQAADSEKLRELAHQLASLQGYEVWVDVSREIANWSTRMSEMNSVVELWIADEETLQTRRKAWAELRTTVPPNWSDDQIQTMGRTDGADAKLMDLAQSLEASKLTQKAAETRVAMAKEQAYQRMQAVAALRGEATEDFVRANQSHQLHLAALERKRQDIEVDKTRLRSWLEQADAAAFSRSGQKTVFAKAIGSYLAAFVSLIGALLQATFHHWRIALLMAFVGLAVLMPFGWRRRHQNVALERPFLHLTSIDFFVQTRADASTAMASIEQASSQLDAQFHRESLLSTALSSWQQARERQEACELEERVLRRQIQAADETFQTALTALGLDDTPGPAQRWMRLGETARTLAGMERDIDGIRGRIRERQALWQTFCEELVTWMATPQGALVPQEYRDRLPDLSEGTTTSVGARSLLEQCEKTWRQWLDRATLALDERAQSSLFQQQYDRLTKDMEERERQVNLMDEKVQGIFEMIGVSDRFAYDVVMDRETLRIELHRRYERCLQDLVIIAGGERQAARVKDAVQGQSEGSLSMLVTQAEERAFDAERKKRDTQEELWNIRQALAASQTDPTGADIRWRLAQADADVQHLRETYAALIMAKELSRLARTRLEQGRVSPVVDHAGRYLAELTQHRYTRIQIPLGDVKGDQWSRVNLIDPAGRSWPLDEMSRGTREQVYLALRLAVVRQFRERGLILPVILDDPLVNFDDERAAAALHLLRREAEAAPIFYFTCHQQRIQSLRGVARTTSIQMAHAVQEK